MSISSRIEAIEQHLTDDYSVLELAGADLTNVDKNILNLKMTWQERLLYFINNGTDVVWNNWEKVEGTGESLSLNSTEEAPMEIDLKGNTSQETTTGKNLLAYPYYNTTKTINGITFTDNGDGTINANGTASANASFFLLGNANNQEEIKGNYISGGASYNVKVRAVNLTSGTYTVLGSSEGSPTSLNKSTYSIGYIEIVIVNGTTVNNLTIKPMLTNNEDSDYEPYTNGASPNPDYPQDVHVVTGDNTINICGKNLFDGVFRQGNISHLSNTTRIFSIQNLYLESGKSYTISTNLNTSLYKYAIALSDTMYPVPTGFYDSGWKTISSFTFTPSRSGYFGLGVAKSNGTDNLTPSDIANVNWQLELGNQATTYEEYKGGSYPIYLGNIELCKIGNYQDSIVKDNGKWYLNKQIGKIVLNGSETWTNSSTGSVNRFYTGAYSAKIAGLPTTTSAYCNYYRYGGAISNPTQKGTFAYNVSSGTSVTNGNLTLVTTDYYTTSTQLKNALETNNAIIYHQLVTPTYTEITDSTLLSQLEAVKKSYTTQTNISQENNDKPFILDVTALKQLTQ